jgi:hypothetical protein
MPFDPTQPVPGSPVNSQVMRDQFQALFDLIQNVTAISGAQINSVTTFEF